MKTQIKLFLVAVVAMLTFMTSNAQSYAIVNGYHVNVRSYPSTQAPVIYQLNTNTRVTIDYNRSTQTGWTPIIYNGNVYGYINNQFLTFPKQQQATPKQSGNRYAIVTGDHVNVRAQPDLRSQVIYQLNRNAKVVVDRNRKALNGYTPIIINGSVYGYISTQYLAFY